MKIDKQDILESYDVSSLFTNVPVDETIKILAEKAFKDDWFNKPYTAVRDCYEKPAFPIRRKLV